MQNEEKRCTNCSHFYQYYFKRSDAVLYPANGKGICFNVKVLTRVSESRIKKDAGCEYWKPMCAQVKARGERIEVILRDISKRLNDVAIILESDKNEK